MYIFGKKWRSPIGSKCFVYAIPPDLSLFLSIIFKSSYCQKVIITNIEKQKREDSLVIRRTIDNTSMYIMLILSSAEGGEAVIRAARQEDTLWWESVVDGPGVRLVLFLSGCSHACPGCHNAWLCDYSAGEALRESDVVEELLGAYNPHWHDGITISGGDPFFQSIELATLLQLIKSVLPALNIWIYTGYLYEQLAAEPALLYCDILVDGPFIAARANEGQSYRGSGNQRIIHLERGVVTEIEALALPPSLSSLPGQADEAPASESRDAAAMGADSQAGDAAENDAADGSAGALR